ncbi:hypothetical protein [Neisseria perflava]|uniref:hypothetical protein n=1 Tax=Neisseria perflava TaxID=33053 RepID=UPI00209CFF07|nr:hypothetical protein [Neisseria perflava]MCP1661059.1 hypothetical protein [Neisseria perflava]
MKKRACCVATARKVSNLAAPCALQSRLLASLKLRFPSKICFADEVPTAPRPSERKFDSDGLTVL